MKPIMRYIFDESSSIKSGQEKRNERRKKQQNKKNI